MNRPATLATLMLVVLAGSLAAGVGSPATLGAVDGQRSTLRVAELVAPTLDPALASSPDAVLVQNALCDRLYSSSGPSGTAAAQIARALPSAAPDPQRPRQWTTYTIKLRPNYRFQDGTPVTAYSFAAAFGRDADPDEQSPALAELRVIVGAAAVEQSQASAISGVQALNDWTLAISTLRLEPGLAALLSQPYFCPVEEDTPIAPTGVLDPPSAGPFYVAAQTPGQILLERNPYYGGSRGPRFNAITLRTGVSFDACQREVREGSTDICLDALPQHAEAVSLPALIRQGWISRRLGCLAWQPVVRIDLVSLCEAA
jgi:peptide/nickel transport system substrate-binding protein